MAKPYKIELIEQIFNDIISDQVDQLSVAMILPEKDLVVKYNRGRTPIREALTWLATNGIISRISGKGSYINSIEDWNIFDPTVSSWLIKYNIINEKVLSHMWEARSMIEPYANAAAAIRATDDEIAIIEADLAQMKIAVLENSREHYSICDSKFHQSIIKASHNIIWEKQSILMEPLLGSLLKKCNLETKLLSESYQLHQEIFTGIKGRDPDYTFLKSISLMELSAKDYFNKQIKCSLKPSNLDFFLS